LSRFSLSRHSFQLSISSANESSDTPVSASVPVCHSERRCSSESHLIANWMLLLREEDSVNIDAQDANVFMTRLMVLASARFCGVTSSVLDVA